MLATKDRQGTVECCKYKNTRLSLKKLLYSMSGIPIDNIKIKGISEYDNKVMFTADYKRKNETDMLNICQKIGQILYETLFEPKSEEEIRGIVEVEEYFNTYVITSADLMLSLALDIINDNLDIVLSELRSLNSLNGTIYLVNKMFAEVGTYICNKNGITTIKQEQTSIDKIIDNDMVDTSKIGIGMVIKNYKILCELLGEQVINTGGNQRKCQLQKFERFFRWEKNGQKFIILDIYDEPLPKKDDRKNGNNTIYIKYIETIVLKYIQCKKGKTCSLTKRQLWDILGMINNHYNNIPLRQLQKEPSLCELRNFDLQRFYLRCNSMLTRILFSALSNLRKRSLIMYESEIIIVESDTNGKLHYHIANDKEKQMILRVERDVLIKMGFASTSHAACCMKLEEFYHNVNDELFERYGWDHKFERIKLIFNREDVIDGLRENEYELQKLMLNEIIVEAVNKNAETVFNNREKKSLIEYKEYIDNGNNWFGKVPSIEETNIFRYPESYVKIQKELSKKLLQLRDNEVVPINQNQNQDIDAIFDDLGVS